MDCETVRAVAHRFNAAADILDQVFRTRLSGLRFDGSTAGRAHTARGDELHVEFDRLTASVAQWSRAAVEMAVVLRTEAGRYAEAELRSAARVA